MLLSSLKRVLLIPFAFILVNIHAFRVPARFVLRLKPNSLQHLHETPAEIENAWIDESSKDIVIQMKPANPTGEASLFDMLYNSEDNDGSEATISCLTLREISECYSFSLSYLGDFVMQMGSDSPVDVDVKIGDFLTGQQIYTLLQALNTLDPYETNAEYDTLNLIELADDMNLHVEAVIKICEREDIHLPFGVSTMLHISVVEQLRRAAELDAEVPDRKSTQHNKLPIQDI